MSTERLLTIKEAAALTRLGDYTIRRRVRAESYPNADLVEGTYLIPVSDLVAFGDLDPMQRDDEVELSPPVDIDTARVARLEEAVCRLESDNEFLRSLLMQQSATRAV